MNRRIRSKGYVVVVNGAFVNVTVTVSPPATVMLLGGLPLLTVTVADQPVVGVSVTAYPLPAPTVNDCEPPWARKKLVGLIPVVVKANSVGSPAAVTLFTRIVLRADDSRLTYPSRPGSSGHGGVVSSRYRFGVPPAVSV